MTAMYFSSLNFIYFQQKESIKGQSWWIVTWSVESLKFCTLMGSFCPNHVQFQLKKYRRVISHDTEQWYKIWINLDLVVSKLAWEIGWTFTKALKNLKICALMGSFCWKRNVSARKFQRNYVSWHWKVTQNLSENWLVTWKMTRNSVNFYASSWKFENLHLMGSFCRKDIKFYIKKYRRVISHGTGEWCKVWRKTSSWFQKLHDKFGKFSWEQFSENFHFDVLLLSIAYKVSAKKNAVISHDTEEWSKLWRKTHFLFEKWHEKFDVF